jgi:hypothetical protein
MARQSKLTYRDCGALIVFQVRLGGDGPRVFIAPTHRKAVNFARKNTVAGVVSPVFVFPGELDRDKALRLMRERVHATPGSYWDGALRRQIEALQARCGM